MSANTILIIDDDPDIRNLLKLYLDEEGYTVVQAVDGSGGLLLAESQPPDLVLLDLALPSGDGLTVLRRLKNTTELKDVPVIVISGLRSNSCRDAVTEAQASDFLPKPIDKEALLAAVRRCLDEANDRDAAPCAHCGRTSSGMDMRTIEKIAERAAIAAVQAYANSTRAQPLGRG